MTARELTKQFTAGGSVFTVHMNGDNPQSLVIASEIALGAQSLAYYVIGQPFTGGVHRLVFDELRAIHHLGVEFFRNGERIAYLCPVDESDDESVAAWQQWQAWLAAGNQEQHAKSIAAEFRSIDAE